jgi:hypothetical protein
MIGAIWSSVTTVRFSSYSWASCVPSAMRMTVLAATGLMVSSAGRLSIPCATYFAEVPPMAAVGTASPATSSPASTLTTTNIASA